MARTFARKKTVLTILTTTVIVTAFIHLQGKRTFADNAEQPAVAIQKHENDYIRDTRRSLLKFKFQRIRLKDAFWTAGPNFKDEVRTESEKRNLFMEIKNQLMNKNLPNIIGTTSESTPSVTDAPTRPVTTQSDTTPIFTDAPTSPITTESITTPLTTLPGEKELTTETGDFLYQTEYETETK